MTSEKNITSIHSYIENSIYNITPDIILNGDVYGTDYDYKYNINTNKNSNYEDFFVTDIAKVDINMIKSNFRKFLKYTNNEKELINKESKKKYLLEIFTNKFLLKKILNDEKNNILIINSTLLDKYKKIKDYELDIKKEYELLKPINNDINRLQEKKINFEKKKQNENQKIRNEMNSMYRKLSNDLEQLMLNKKTLMEQLTETTNMRESIKDDKKKRSQFVKLNSKIETIKGSIKQDNTNIESLQKKIKTIEEKMKILAKSNESENLKELLEEYINKKDYILKKINSFDNDKKELQKDIKSIKKQIIEHNIRILVSEIFTTNSFYYLNEHKFKIINNPSNEKNINIKIIEHIKLPTINIEKIENDYINKYIQDNIKKLYKESLIISGKINIDSEFTITKEMEGTKEYKEIKSQLNKEANKNFSKDKSKIINREKEKIIDSYKNTIKREKIDEINKLDQEKMIETDIDLKKEIQDKIDNLQKEKDKLSINFKENNDILIPEVNLKKSTNINVSIALRVKLIHHVTYDKNYLYKLKNNIKYTCKNRRNKIKSMLNNAASRKIFKIEKTGNYISDFKTKKGGKKRKYTKKRRYIKRL